MPKPPKATPHSDIDGVNRDERSNVEVATELGQDAGDVEAVRRERVAKPPYTEDQENKDDRTR